MRCIGPSVRAALCVREACAQQTLARESALQMQVCSLVELCPALAADAQCQERRPFRHSSSGEPALGSRQWYTLMHSAHSTPAPLGAAGLPSVPARHSLPTKVVQLPAYTWHGPHAGYTPAERATQVQLCYHHAVNHRAACCSTATHDRAVSSTPDRLRRCPASPTMNLLS
jgi:hypothetical protein